MTAGPNGMGRRHRRRAPGALAIALLGALPALATARASVVLRVDGLLSWQGRNDVQSPNDATGTRFALDAITGDGPFVAPRIELSGPVGERGEWRVLAAPLSIEEDGSTTTPIRFEGQVFVPGVVRAGYRFDSWRATWRYRWIDRPDLLVKVGFTAKIRDAEIELAQGASRARKSNSGFVPLLHASVERPFAESWRFEADIDALAGGPGYAVDLGVALSRALGANWRVYGGIRYLDGGADTDEVYTFARFSSIQLGVSRRFD